MRVPDAFADVYRAKVNEVSRHDADLHSVKRLLRHQTLLPWLTIPRMVTLGIFAAYGLALAAIVR